MAAFFHFIISTIIHIAASEIITCDNSLEECYWICPGNDSCNGNTYHCPSTTPKCSLQCGSCYNLKIYSSSDQFTILCTNPKGCANIEITTETPTSKINLRCLKSMSNCHDITFNCQQSISNCQCFDATTKKSCNNQINFASNTFQPTDAPSGNPTNYPTQSPSEYPSQYPNQYPTQNPNKYPTKNPVKTGSTLQAHTPIETRITDEGIAVESTITHTKDSLLIVNDSTSHLINIWIGVAIFFTGCVAMALLLQLYTKLKKSKLNRTKCKSKSFDDTESNVDNINQKQNEQVSIDKIQIEGAETNALPDEMDNNAEVKDKPLKPVHIVQVSNAESNNNNAFEGICVSPETNSDIDAMYKIQRSTLGGIANAVDDDVSRCVDEIEFTESNIEKPLPLSPLPDEISVDNHEDQEVILEKIWNKGPIVIE